MERLHADVLRSYFCLVKPVWAVFLVVISYHLFPSTPIKGGYRPVEVPSDTASRFQDVASTNTRKNVETCGILAGKLVSETGTSLPPVKYATFEQLLRHI